LARDRITRIDAHERRRRNPPSVDRAGYAGPTGYDTPRKRINPETRDAKLERLRTLSDTIDELIAEYLALLNELHPPGGHAVT
jgi:hypothetical protein